MGLYKEACPAFEILIASVSYQKYFLKIIRLITPSFHFTPKVFWFTFLP